MMEKSDSKLPEYTAKDVAAHNTSGDLWIIVHGEVFDVSKYVHDHPGGADVFSEIAGVDGSDAFENAQHSEDALELKAELRVGRVKGDDGVKRTAKAVRLVTQAEPSLAQEKNGRWISRAIIALCIALPSSLVYFKIWRASPSNPGTNAGELVKGERKGLGFREGVIITSVLFALFVGFIVRRFLAKMSLWSGQWRYQPHMKIPRKAKPDLLNERGWLDPAIFQKLPLTKKELLAPNTYRFSFALPKINTILGLPIGQHVSIRGLVDGKAISRSYTPISNNLDRGVLDLVVRCYDNGLFTNGYLRELEVGDEVEFRGPKGGIRYQQGMCKKIGMVAGGTGITPMYQLIRAICENQRDTTEISLIYANRTEQDILLRGELDTFARRYPLNFRIHYMLDQAPVGWTGGSGFVTGEIMEEHFEGPSPTTKIFVCGPPPMVDSVKKSLGTLGFKLPGAIIKPSDEILCF